MMTAFEKSYVRIPRQDIILSTVTINILSLSLPMMTLQIYDRILPNAGTGTLPVLVTGVVIAVMLDVAMRLWRSYIMGWAGAAFEHRMACAAFHKMINEKLTTQPEEGVGLRLQRLASLARLKDFYSGSVVATLIDACMVPLYIVLIAYIAGPLAFVPVAILMVFVSMTVMQGQAIRNYLKKRDDADANRYDFLIESIEGVHALKSFALEHKFARHYERLEEKSVEANLDVMETAARSFNLTSLFSHLMLVSVITGGSLLVLKGMATTGALVATILLSGRLMQPVQKGLNLWMRYQDFLIARDRVEHVFDRIVDTRAEDKDVAPLMHEGRMSVSELTLHAGEGLPPLFDNAEFSLMRGECVLLDAEDRRQTTALLEVLAGVIMPESGQVTVDGLPMRQIAPEVLNRYIGYVQKEAVLFRGTIRDNLTCFGQIPEKNVRELSALLDVDRAISFLPNGYDTFLSGHGSDVIAPGLRQRIAMVRALAAKPRLILFDHADKSLDRDGYNLVHALLARLHGRVTFLMVTEDENLRSLATRRLEIRDGKVIDTVLPHRPVKQPGYKEILIP